MPTRVAIRIRFDDSIVQENWFGVEQRLESRNVAVLDRFNGAA
jgi:hypothetical protein